MLLAATARSWAASGAGLTPLLARHASDLAGRTVAVTGASGLVGTALTEYLATSDARVLRVVRKTPTSTDELEWSPRDGVIDEERLAEADAVIHLAGSNIGAGPLGLPRWTAGTKDEIMESRRLGTRTVASALHRMGGKPRVLVSASGVGYYGTQHGAHPLTEDERKGSGFLAEVADVWEQEAAGAAREDGSVRVTIARLGVVLTPKGGALARMMPPFQMGVGGRMGGGSQFMSWISLRDAARALAFLASPAADDLSGPVNVVAPKSVTNSHFTRALGNAVGMPTLCPLPEPAVRLMFGEMGEETLLCSQNAVPRQLRRAGFTWELPSIEEALQKQLRGRAK